MTMGEISPTFAEAPVQGPPPQRAWQVLCVATASAALCACAALLKADTRQPPPPGPAPPATPPLCRELPSKAPAAAWGLHARSSTRLQVARAVGGAASSAGHGRGVAEGGVGRALEAAAEKLGGGRGVGKALGAPRLLLHTSMYANNEHG